MRRCELCRAFLGALFLAVELLSGDDEAMQSGTGLRLVVAQGGQRMGGDRLQTGGFRLRAGAFGDLAQIRLELAFGAGEFGARSRWRI